MAIAACVLTPGIAQRRHAGFDRDGARGPEIEQGDLGVERGPGDRLGLRAVGEQENIGGFLERRLQFERQRARRAPARPGEAIRSGQRLAFEPQHREAVAGDQRDPRRRARADLREEPAGARRADIGGLDHGYAAAQGVNDRLPVGAAHVRSRETRQSARAVAGDPQQRHEAALGRGGFADGAERRFFGRRLRAGARQQQKLGVAEPQRERQALAEAPARDAIFEESLVLLGAVSSTFRCLKVMSPLATSEPSRILMLTSWSEVLTPATLSIASVLILPPPQRVLDPRALREAEVAALADDLAAQLVAVDADGVVGLVAGLDVRLGGGLHVGADAAVPQQVDGRPQDRLDQLVGRRAPPPRCRAPRGPAATA